ncbi:hypothetical protein GXM_03750 [Nostoc sphaeroides CCNUC1]|uniref:Uncharacterized protein n=1 Tax=Nostoc sphaeroides CCNUC1 TaxID=2653204 RepID=A0A5P8W0S8_9NOSO|nr:hypothetical protein GXM_03750 [Nostoc sphaeroides CCNUC1]
MGDNGTRGEKLQQVFPNAQCPIPNAPFPHFTFLCLFL